MIWFSSDHHFNHKRILEYCADTRPYTNIEEMNSIYIDNWNSVVKPSDTVYYLGDFVMGGVEEAVAFATALNGRIYFIEGNHDSRWYGKIKNFEYLPPIYELKHNKQLYVLSHYPLRAWNKSFHGSYSVYGHEHGKMPPHGLSFDIGVDCWNGYPVSIEEVNERMESIKYEKSDL